MDLRTHFMTTIEDATLAPETRAFRAASPASIESSPSSANQKGPCVEFPTDQCIHQIIEEQVRRTPDATALIFGHERLTYRELNRRADVLADALQRLELARMLPWAYACNPRWK